MALTDTAVGMPRPQGKEYPLIDADGLALCVAPTGAKSWHFPPKFGILADRGVSAARLKSAKFPLLLLLSALIADQLARA